MSQILPDRRSALRNLGAGVVGASLASSLALGDAPKIKGNLKQSICRWCYSGIPLEKLCAIAKGIGYQSIELLSPDEAKKVKAAGLTCALMGGADIANGLNRKEYHDAIVKKLTGLIDFAADENLPAVICMSGNRKGLDDEAGLKMCIVGLKRVIGHAETKKVTLIMEGLNSKVDHKDYMYDKTTWGVELCKALGSDRFKLLFDIYHMQIMEGDVIRTIRTFKDYIGHYHTGGNPGRNEIDETQELNYAAIAKAIVATGFKGYLAQEFIPKRDAAASLKQAFETCDV